jgi:hypothetical protein
MVDQHQPVQNAADKFGSCVISGFRHEVDEKLALVGYCTAIDCDFLPTFRNK